MSLSSLSILIVDDEAEIATLFKDFFQGLSINAVAFTNPFLAFEYFKENISKFYMVITDLRMPGICGIELSKKIRELNDSIKIFLMTAFDTADLESSETYLTAKIDRIIQKPIRLAALKKLIEETVEIKEER